MIGVGPYLRASRHAAGRPQPLARAPTAEQVPATEVMTYKVIALARLACPRANIPATTALATLNTPRGSRAGPRARGQRGHAQPDAAEISGVYEIYPEKACIAETGEACHHCLDARIAGHRTAAGRGTRRFAELSATRPRPTALESWEFE